MKKIILAHLLRTSLFLDLERLNSFTRWALLQSFKSSSKSLRQSFRRCASNMELLGQKLDDN